MTLSQKEFPVTGVGGTGGTVPGTVNMTINASGDAVAVGVGSPVPIGYAGGNNIVAGQNKLTAAGTAQALVATATPIAAFITIEALSANTGKITLGGATVNDTINGTGNGFILAPGDSIAWYGADASQLYFNGTATGDIVTYFGN